MLIHRPQLHLCMRISVLDLLDPLWELAFERLLLLWISLVVTRTGDLEREADFLEILPATLGMDCVSNLSAHPLGDFRAAPQASISRSLRKHLL